MSGPAGLAALLRVERRELRRHPWRSLLVALLVAVPVAAVVGGATLARITEPTAAERRAHAMGRAAARVAYAAPEGWRTVARVLPDGARTAEVFLGRETVTHRGRRLRAALVALAPAALADRGLAAGMVRLQAGAAPAHPGQVALSPTLLAGLAVGVGDSVTLAYGPRREVTGVVVDPEDLARPLVLRTPAAVEHGGRHLVLLAEAPPGRIAALKEAGLEVTTAAEAGGRDGTLTALVFALGAVGFLEAALVVAATFAVGLRRRRYEIGLLGATGAPPGRIAAAVLLSTAQLAAAGTAAGAALGAGTAAALHPFLDAWNARVNGPFEVPAAAVAAALALGVVTAVAGAWLPVRATVRLPVREALGARRPPSDRPRRWLLAGLVLVAAALAVLALAPRDHALLGGLAVVGGPLLGLLGLGACSPWLLHVLSRRAARLPVPWRLALRDAGRFRDRHGPVVTAVLAGMAMSVTLAVLVASLEQALAGRPQALGRRHVLVAGPAAAEAAERLARAWPGSATAPLQGVYAAGELVRVRGDGTEGEGTVPWIACGDAALLRALGLDPAAADDAAPRLLARVRNAPGSATLVAWRTGRALHRLPVLPVAGGEAMAEPAWIMTLAAVDVLGLEAGPPRNRSLVPWLVRLDREATPAVLDRARTLLADLPGTTLDARHRHQQPVRTYYHVVLGLCVLTGLVIVGLATALSAAESADDAHVLHTVGASPALLRTQLAARAGYLALLGCVLAVPAGLLPAMALFSLANIPLGFVMMPWRDLALTVLALPVLAFAGTWLLAPPPRAPRRAWLLAAAALLAAGPAAAADPPTIRWEPFVGEAFDGRPLAGELGRLRVPEDRADPDGRTVELVCVRYRTARPDPGPPIVVLVGGPGGSGVDRAGPLATHPQLRLLEHADVIGLDQRGTGRSRPCLMGDPVATVALPLDRAATRSDVVDAVRAAVAGMVRTWRARGVDPAAYHTRAAADDIDDLRRALGAARVVTFGTSYGTHLALAHLRRHGGTVARSVLRKVEGPGDTFKRPAPVQAQLDRLHRRALAERGLDLLGTLAGLLDDLAAAPRVVTAHAGTDSATTLTVGSYDLQLMAAAALATSAARAALPSRLERLARGDWEPLAVAALDRRRFALPLLPVLVDCASGAGAARRARLERERQDPRNLLGDALQWPLYPACCPGTDAADLGDVFRAPVVSDVPVLLVSGALDARTPRANAAALLPGLPRGRHVVVEQVGHESRELMSEAFRGLLQAFLRGEEVRGCTLALPPVLLREGDVGPP